MEGENWKTINREGFSTASLWARWGRWIGIGAVLFVALVMSGFGVLNWQRAVRAEGEDMQNKTTAKYQAVQTTLSTCLDKSLQAASVAQQERDSLRGVLTDVIKERSNKGQTAIPSDAGMVISVVAEQYPSISPDLYKQLMTVVTGCRNEVNGTQLDLQAFAARFKSWTKAGSFVDGLIRESYPNDNLVAEGPNGQLKGKTALEFMAAPIITDEADAASKNKRMPQQQLFPSASPTPNR